MPEYSASICTITTERALRHICEVCGRDEILTPGEAFDAGWDYPPRMGIYGVVSPRVCPGCPITATAWWALTVDRTDSDALTERQRAAVERIAGEPESLTP